MIINIANGFVEYLCEKTLISAIDKTNPIKV
jgi:hypothetical protein